MVLLVFLMVEFSFSLLRSCLFFLCNYGLFVCLGIMFGYWFIKWFNWLYLKYWLFVFRIMSLIILRCDFGRMIWLNVLLCMFLMLCLVMSCNMCLFLLNGLYFLMNSWWYGLYFFVYVVFMLWKWLLIFDLLLYCFM